MTSTKAGTYQLIPMSQVRANPNQPRKDFSADSLNGLAESIREHGLLQPITVTHRGNGVYQIIAGERRWRACQINEMVEVPAIVRGRMADDQVFRLSVLENVARQDMTVIEEANAYDEIIGMGYSVADVAAMLGKSELHVTRRIDLLRLRDDYQHLAACGQMGTMLAWNLSRLSLNGQSEVMRKVVAGEFKGDWDAVRYAAAVYTREQQPALISDQSTMKRSDSASRDRNRAEKAWEKIEAIGPAMAEILEMDVSELANALGGDVSLYQDRMDVLYKTVHAVRAKLHNTAATHEAYKPTEMVAD